MKTLLEILDLSNEPDIITKIIDDMARNLKTKYEEVDCYETQVQRKSNCAICSKVLLKGEIVQKVHYCQLGGFLIQHKYMCLNHTVPYLYTAGFGFQFTKRQINET